jgi:hypothetical protein
MATMSDVLPVISIAVSVIVLLLGALGRETVGEVKRRVSDLERRDETRGREVAQLDERSRGMTDTLKRIEEQMVPRAEWEARHQSTDSMLERILNALSDRASKSELEPPPQVPRRTR